MRSEVQLLPGPPVVWLGALAQLGERLLCKHQVIGSIPISSTICVVIYRVAAMALKISRDEDSGLPDMSGDMARMACLFDIVNGFF